MAFTNVPDHLAAWAFDPNRDDAPCPDCGAANTLVGQYVILDHADSCAFTLAGWRKKLVVLAPTASPGGGIHGTIR
jgi:hypothetical protein